MEISPEAEKNKTVPVSTVKLCTMQGTSLDDELPQEELDPEAPEVPGKPLCDGIPSGSAQVPIKPLSATAAFLDRWG